MSWFHEVNPQSEIIDKIFKDAVDVGAYENNKKDRFMVEHCLSVCIHSCPNFKDESLEFVCVLMLWLFTIDDGLDLDNVDDSESLPLVKRIEYLLINHNATSPNSPTALTKMEKYTLFFLEKLTKLTKDREDLFNYLISSCIRWIRSIIPLCKIRDLSRPSHFELFSFVRTINIGIEVCSIAAIVGFFDDNLNFDIRYLYSPRWEVILQSCSMIIALVNDVASFGKEIDQGIGDLNLMSSISKRHGLSLEQTYYTILTKIDDYMNEINQNEEPFLSSIKDPTQRELYQQYIDQVHYFLTGNLNWSLSSKRYRSNSSPFIEFQKFE
eukprot:gene6279-7824_t